MSKPNAITALISFEEYQSVITTGTSIIKFSSAWCTSCKRIAGSYELLANTNSNVQFYEVNIDKVPQIAIKEQIAAIPAFIIYHNGERLFSYFGANEQKIREVFDTGLTYIDNKSILLTNYANNKLSSLMIDDNSNLNI